MPRFFVAAENILKSTVLITDENARHIKVLRMKPGEKLVVSDGVGKDYVCRLTSSDGSTAQAEIEDFFPCLNEPNIKCTVLAGFPKSEKADAIIQKCTELGASEIAFFPCERCVSRPDKKSAEKKLIRWQRIALEAAKQSGRGLIPQISILDSFVCALDAAVKTQLPLLMYETGDGRASLRGALKKAGGFSSCAIITGPEGGFEKFEADLAAASGITCCSMGPRILRCETAPVCALSAVMYETGNLD